MPATLGAITTTEVSSGTLAGILKDFFLTPVQEQLTQEVMALELFEKDTVTWNGLQAIIPVHTARNAGVGSRAENGTLPVAGNQTVRRLAISARYIYGSFSLSGPAIEAAKASNAGALISSMELEMNRVKDDVRDYCNRKLFSGQRIVGFIHEHVAGGGGRQWEFSGDTARLAEMLVEALGNVDCQILRMDTYASIYNDEFSAVDQTGSRITLVAALDTTAGGVNAIPTGVAMAVMVDEALVVTKDSEPQGLYGNLAEAAHFGQDRTDATGDVQLQSIIQTHILTGDHSRGTLAAKRLQGIFDEIHLQSGQEPDVLLSHPVMRQEYTALMNNAAASMALDPRTAAKQGDLGFSGVSFNGKPWTTSRHCGRGLIIFLNKASWCIAELAKFQFADLDGNVLSRVANQDTWGGFLRWYMELVCKRPNANAILVGIQFDGAVDGA